MTEENKKPDYIGNIIVFILFGLLIYAGIISYQSIDWNVLKKLESNPLVLPTPMPTLTATPSAQISPTNTATTSSTKKGTNSQ